MDRVRDAATVPRLAAVAVLLLGAGVVAATVLPGTTGGEPVNASALFCDDSAADCRVETVEQRPASCAEWYPYQGEDALDCTFTEEDVADVALVTDPANHVMGRMSDADVAVNAMSYGLTGTFDLEFLPDGSMLLTEKEGDLIRIQDGEKTEIASLDVFHEETTGLMGVAVDPEFADNRYIYLAYTTGEREYDSVSKDPDVTTFVTNRVSRFRLVNGTLQDETVLRGDIPGSIYHNGGRLEFGPDGMLYASTGDGGLPRWSQDPDLLHGKVLRMAPDGSVPDDNPGDNRVYASGFKNPQGFDWHPGTGAMYATEHGNWRHDELNRIEPGANYGWGALTCDENTGFGISVRGDPEPPLWCARNFTFAPSSMVFVDEPGHPWHGDLFVTALRGKHLHRFTVEDGAVTGSEIFWVNEEAPDDSGLSRRLRDVEFRDGEIRVLADWGGIIRLQPAG